MGKYLDYYCGNQYAKLKTLVNKLIQTEKFGWLPQSEYDDIYSIAGQVVWNCERKFDESKGATFETYLTECLQRKIRTRITYLNRKKRCSDRPVLSIEKAMGDEEKCNLKSQLKAYEKPDILPLTQRYLDSLPRGLREIVKLFMDGYDDHDVKKILGLTDKQFNMALERIKTNDSVRFLNALKEKLQ